MTQIETVRGDLVTVSGDYIRSEPAASSPAKVWFTAPAVAIGGAIGLVCAAVGAIPVLAWVTGIAAAAAVFAGLSVRQGSRDRQQRLGELRAARRLLLEPFSSGPLAAGEVTMATLLAADRAVVRFEGRQAERDHLLRWCQDPTASSIAVLTGHAGVGKSRLAVEVAGALPVQWARGRWVDQDANRLVNTVLSCADPTLIIVDDPDTQPLDAVATLVRRCAQRDETQMDETQIKVLLVVRDGRAIEQSLHRVLPDRLAVHWPTTTLTPFGTVGDRRRWFTNAARTYSAAQGWPPPLVTDTDLSPVGTDGEPMVITQARALVSAQPGSGQHSRTMRIAGLDAVAGALFDSERKRWDHAAKDSRFALPSTATMKADLASAMLALVLLQPASVNDAVTVLRRIPALGKRDDSMLRGVVTWAHYLYPGPAAGQVIPAAEFLTGVLLTELARTPDGELIRALKIGKAAQANQRILLQLLRAVPLFPSTGALIGEILRQKPGLVTTVIETSVPMGESARAVQPLLVAALATTHNLSSVNIERLLDLPYAGRWGRLQVELHTIKVQHARESTDTDSNLTTRGVLAESLVGLHLHLREVGEYRRALTAAEEAVGLYRELVVEEPARYTPTLSEAVLDLSGSLRSVGEHRRALAAAEEAVGLYRELVVEEPAQYTQHLASAVRSLGVDLWEVGEYRRAVAATEEAVGLYRELVLEEPALHTKHLATAVRNLGAHLREVSQHQKGLVATEEAVRLIRKLVVEEPTLYTPDLAKALQNLGTLLSEVGEYQQGSAATEEAVGLYRELVVKEPARYTPDLALALQNLGAPLQAVGEARRGRAATKEAVGLLRELVVEEPARHTAGLASAVHNLAIDLDRSGQEEEALKCRAEITARWGHLARLRPGAYEKDYARAQAALARHCAQKGYDPDIAVRAEEESIHTWELTPTRLGHGPLFM